MLSAFLMMAVALGLVYGALLGAALLVFGGYKMLTFLKGHYAHGGIFSWFPHLCPGLSGCQVAKWLNRKKPS